MVVNDCIYVHILMRILRMLILLHMRAFAAKVSTHTQMVVTDWILLGINCFMPSLSKDLKEGMVHSGYLRSVRLPKDHSGRW